jgi:hypothetical protein
VPRQSLAICRRASWELPKTTPRQLEVEVITRNDVIRYLMATHYKDDVGSAAIATEFTKQQINDWISNKKTPQIANVGHFMHKTFAPEFKVLGEYVPITISGSAKQIRSEVRTILKGHTKVSGIYAFYDTMANLIYLGKSDGNLFEEIIQQLQQKIGKRVFPRGAKQPKTRLDIVRYVSAYYVKGSDFEDYAKHVESLILRISKPILNKNIGSLQLLEEGPSG